MSGPCYIMRWRDGSSVVTTDCEYGERIAREWGDKVAVSFTHDDGKTTERITSPTWKEAERAQRHVAVKHG
jgi:hypothetical protein